MAAARLLSRKRAFSVLCLSMLLEEDEGGNRTPNRKVYMRDWISRREERGIYHQLIKELEVGDSVAYKEFFRMAKQQFCFLVGKVSPLIQKKEQPPPINLVRTTIQPDERLAGELGSYEEALSLATNSIPLLIFLEMWSMWCFRERLPSIRPPWYFTYVLRPRNISCPELL